MYTTLHYYTNKFLLTMQTLIDKNKKLMYLGRYVPSILLRLWEISYFSGAYIQFST